MQFLATYLKLAPEFGGTEFGPYEDLEISLGSQQASCNIFIPPNFGVLPIHAKIIRKSATDVVLAPAEQSAEIFLWKGRARNCNRIYVPTAVKSGDSFALVSPQGPKFTIEYRELPPEEIKIRQESIAKKKGLSGKGRLSKESLAAEAKRQAWTTILVSGPAQLAQRAIVFVKSGAIFQPRNIFLGLTLIGGYVFGGFTACRSKRIQTQLTTTKTEYKRCEESNVYLKNLGEEEKFGFEGIVASLITPELAQALSKDNTLRSVVKKEARYLFEKNYEDDEYKWILGKNNGIKDQYRRWITAVNQEDDFDDTTKRVITWLPPVENKESDGFRSLVNSDEKNACGKGIVALTYRQAQNLGLNAQPDAYYEGKESYVEEPKKRSSTLLEKVSEYKLDPDLLPEYYQNTDEEDLFADDPDSTWQKTGNNTYCVYQSGSDDRENRSQIIKMLKDQYSRSDMEEANILAKVARIYTADIAGENYSSSKNRSRSLKFRDKIGSELDASDLVGKEWAVKSTARVIARALVIPCMIKLRGNEKIQEAFFGEENPGPNPVYCFALNWRLTEDTKNQ